MFLKPDHVFFEGTFQEDQYAKNREGINVLVGMSAEELIQIHDLLEVAAKLSNEIDIIKQAVSIAINIESLDKQIQKDFEAKQTS